MKPADWEEVQRLFEEALALPEERRAAFLDEQAPDPHIRSEVEVLLATGDPDPEFLSPPRIEAGTGEAELGDFSLLEEIGRGGMGVVYRAIQRPLGRVVAIKVLPANLALTPRQIDRFLREARAVARLSHPNVVSVITVGEVKGVRFFAMEFVEGRNLAEEIKRLRADLDPVRQDQAHLPSSRASDYFRSVAETIRQAADGLAHAHAHGLVHRDIKPSNLLLDVSGRVKIVDFGLVRDESLGSISTSGDLVGTPNYMSPEQARSHGHKVDHRTDIYSLGVVLYELLTLQQPFEGKTLQEVISNVLQREAPSIRKLNGRVPRDLATICQKAMAKAPRERYSDASAMRDDLTRFLAHEAIEARPPSVAARLRSFGFRHRRGLSAATLIVTGALIGWRVNAAYAADPVHVSITAPGHEGAEVWLQSLSPLSSETGERERVGTIPVQDLRVPPGQYRFVVLEKDAFAELTRVLRPGHSYELHAWLRPTAEVLASSASPMVEIPAGEFVWGVEDAGGWAPHFARARVSLPTYWIDRYETSNGEYLRFLEATGHRWPELWPPKDGPAWRALPEDFPRLPVVGLAYADAQAYAEWAGKRLSTQWEWEKAARGPEGWELPWQADSARGRDPSALERAVVARPYLTSAVDVFRNYLEQVEPVDSYPQGSSPYGLLHTLGNVNEWTESLMCYADDAGFVPDWRRHVMRGGAYDQQEGGWALLGYASGPDERETAYQKNGFRCAKSSIP